MQKRMKDGDNVRELTTSRRSWWDEVHTAQEWETWTSRTASRRTDTRKK